MIALASRVFGVGIDSEDMLVRQVLLCGFRDRRAAARYRRLAGAPDEHRRDAPGKGARRVRQQPNSPMLDPARMAVSRISENQRARPMASEAL